MQGMLKLSEQIDQGIVFGDGAMGTELQMRGAVPGACLELLNVEAADVVLGVHRDYIAAGAQVIETNTFGANAVRLARFGLEGRVRELNQAAVGLVRRAIGGGELFLSASVGPLGLTADEAMARGIDAEAVYREQLLALLDAGVRLFQFETFEETGDLLVALGVLRGLDAECEVIATLSCSSEGRLTSGRRVTEAFAELRAAAVGVTGVNCIQGPSAMAGLLRRIGSQPHFAAYPNAGYPRWVNGRVHYTCAPEYFAAQCRTYADWGVRLIGGCCGIGPEQIRAMVEGLQDYRPTPPLRVAVVEGGEEEAVVRVQEEEESILDRIAAGRKVVVTELDPPKTLDLEKFLEGARALVDAGSDCITLADNSLAILRVSNLAVGAMLKERLGIMPLLHVSCRDRNLLGLQSELMGMAALGIRHVLPLTGDPAKVGDHPGAASVYDVNSVKLMEIVAGMNAGYNANGKALKARTRFVIGCTLNPNARQFDTQLKWLERKIAAGACYVMTQPVFDVGLIRMVAERTREMGVPVFMGIWPLLNGRQTEFLHHEVPGIVIPEQVRERMRGLEGAEGIALGLRIAREMIEETLVHFPGVYLITPFLRYETTGELAAFVRGLG